jgi:hypothetical protein
MTQQVTRIDFHALGTAIPAVVILLLIPLTWSIAHGIGYGFIVHVAIRLLSRHGREVQVVIQIAGGCAGHHADLEWPTRAVFVAGVGGDGARHELGRAGWREATETNGLPVADESDGLVGGQNWEGHDSGTPVTPPAAPQDHGRRTGASARACGGNLPGCMAGDRPADDPGPGGNHE